MNMKNEEVTVRHFVLSFNGMDNSGNIQQGNINYISVTGKFKFEDVDHAIAEHCKKLRNNGIQIYPNNCMIFSVFEVDV